MMWFVWAPGEYPRSILGWMEVEFGTRRGEVAVWQSGSLVVEGSQSYWEGQQESQQEKEMKRRRRRR